MTKVCTIEGCGRAQMAKSFCSTHLKRWNDGQRGAELERPIRVHDTSRKCAVVDCGRKYFAKGYCVTHDRRVRKGIPLEPPIRTFIHPRTIGSSTTEWVGLGGAHARVKDLWGSASRYPCIECGNTAMDWAYDGTDPTQLIDIREWKSPSYYSRYPEFYMPMCRPCHRALDGAGPRRELREYRSIKCELQLTYDELREKLGVVGTVD